MKESNFYSDDFEQLIRGKTEQYKMYPSENVWKGVHNSLHTKRKWFIGSMALLVTGILYFSGKELIAPSVHPVTAHRTTAGAGTDLTATDAAAMDPAKTNSAEDNPHSSFASLRPNAITGTSIRRNGSSGGSSGPSSGLSITISNLVISQPDIAQLLSHLAVSGQAPALIAATGASADGATGKTADNDVAEPGLLDSWLVKNNADNTAGRKPADVAAAGRSNTETGFNGGMNGLKETGDVTANKESAGDGAEAAGDDTAVRSVLESLSYKTQQRISGNNHLAHTKAGNAGMIGSDVLPDSAGALSAHASTAVIGENADRQRLNWLHDYAVYTLPPAPEKGRILLQFTLTPTVNYRSLSGGSYPTPKNAEGAPLPSSHPEGVQNWVNLSPGFGFEFGSNVLYRVTRNLSIKGGLQFGFSRYQMPAYASKTQSPNSSLETYYGYYTDSLSSMNSSGSYPGKTTQTITNNFYQLALPLGFELRILGNEQLQFNIAATIQPSYLMNTDSYMLSSDYSTYNKQPSMYRRWNLSGEVEAFLSYQTGPLRWQIGPEFRYQMLSTYTATYPINENVKGYGLKIGITKALP